MAGEAADIRIKVGISTDANASAVMAPIEQAVKRTRKTVDAEMKAAGKSIAKEIDKGTTSGERSWKKLEREVEKMANEMLAADRQASKQGVSLTEQAERRKTEIVQREADKRAAARARAEKKAQQEIKREQEKAAKAVPWYARNLTGSGGYGGAIGIGRRAGIRVGRGAAMAYGYGGAAISGAMGFASDVAQGLGVDTSLSSHVRQAQTQQGLAQKISSAGYVPGTNLVNPKDILAEARAVGNATGTDATEALEALRAFVGKTGDLETGRKTLGNMATLARATGANLEDVANAAAEVSNNLGDVPDKSAVTSQIMQQIAGQGKLGAVEIRDMAAQMAKLAAAASRFQGGAAKNIPLMGVLAQEAKLKGGAASATQAATAVMAFSSDFAQKANLKRWSQRGLTPFADSAHTELSDPKSLIEAALKSASGPKGTDKASLDVLKQLFPSKQGFKAVQGFASIYNEAGGGSKGMKAVEDEFQRLTDAQLANDEVQRAFAASMKTSEAQVTIFNNHMTEVSEQLAGAAIPAFESIAPAIVGWGATLSKWIGDTTGANRQDAIAKIDDEVPVGTAAKDRELVEKTKHQDEGVTAYSQEEFEVVKHHGAVRGQAMAKLQEQVEIEQKGSEHAGSWTQNLPGVNALQKFIGLETNQQKSERLHGQANEDLGRLEQMGTEQKETNALLRQIATTGILVSMKPGVPTPQPGAPQGAATPKDGEQ